ncbi:tail protein X [Undibacterium aquatile]|nr:tail protein X [Undibacterium aquatile]
MMEYIEHITKDGERWDQIAHMYYGDSTKISALSEANEHLRLQPVLVGGLPVRVPILEEEDRLLPQDVPPWKR